MVALASNGHMIIQCGGSFTILAPGSSFMTTRPSFSQWDPPCAIYAIPGTVFDGLGALFIRSPHHCFTAASIHIGSGSGRFITVGMRSEEHTSELQSRLHLVCRLLLEKK